MSSNTGLDRIKKPSTAGGVIYIGAPRKQVVEKLAIEVSFMTGKQITTAQFFQYLIDLYGERAKNEIIKEVGKDRK
ncbi:TPA: hypothetical protein ACGFAK_004778 [Serratia marcescens]|jgi:hypothetical protein|uniref:hypothetical protein n=1 Tax=Enterobacterales TaxID=91347 RepID=UPI000F7EFE39|nr:MULTISPECIES: hypothetical protein [Enterobacterales]HBE9155373.1 hypothetical protein [Serratia fonticola]HDL6704459.1 hypothetical protein [Yersinia enterocolitica]RTF23177.1 hypothetical protein D9B84_07420 [Serratia marcescens]ULG10700.1 hypothetical protein 176p2_00037 [Serratia entomophila]WEO92613.1 hypothetical protein JET59_027805 [Serratia proteamaculans]